MFSKIVLRLPNVSRQTFLVVLSVLLVGVEFSDVCGRIPIIESRDYLAIMFHVKHFP
ncbi:MAG: hypothetical protein Q8N90_03530 [bacterium]|nr:hypothetical protein [bacterium]